MFRFFYTCGAKIAIALLVGVVPAAQAQTQAFPDKPIRLIVPFGPGGATDIVGRLVAEKMSENLGQVVIVENKSGAGGIIGTTAVMRSPPDGYTLVMTTIGAGANPALLGDKLPFDPVKDFTPIAMLTNVPTVLVVHPTSPVRSAKELIELAKAKPGTLTFASANFGTVNHLAGEMLKALTGIDIVHVPYRSGSEAVAAVVSGQVTMLFATTPSALSFIQEGRLIPVAVSGSTPVPQLPDVPLLNETVSGFNVVDWQGIVGPAGMPRPIVEKLNRSIVMALHDPALVKRLGDLGVQVATSTPDEHEEHLKAEVAKWKAVAERTDMSIKQ